MTRPRFSKRHASLTTEVICDAIERHITTLDDPGFCLVCGLEHGGCEPDMRGGECEACGTKTVYGADEILLSVPWT
jgi:hypothetical protein